MEATNVLMEKLQKLVDSGVVEKIDLDDIKLNKKVGFGGQAKVYKGKWSDKDIALKVLTDIDEKCFLNEVEILSKLKHENMPKFYGIVSTKEVTGLVFEFINGKTLDEFKVDELTDLQKVNIAKSMHSALSYMHENKYIHRDLKLENAMMDKNGKVFLIDFGIAKVVHNLDETLTRAKGTIHYLAPEVLDACDLTDEEEIISTVTYKVDSWAYGCIISYLFSGYLPWCNKYSDNAATIQTILMKKKPFPVPENIKSSRIKKIVEMCTVVDFKKRASMQEIAEVLDTIK